TPRVRESRRHRCGPIRARTTVLQGLRAGWASPGPRRSVPGFRGVPTALACRAHGNTPAESRGPTCDADSIRPALFPCHVARRGVPPARDIAVPEAQASPDLRRI